MCQQVQLQSSVIHYFDLFLARVKTPSRFPISSMRSRVSVLSITTIPTLLLPSSLPLFSPPPIYLPRWAQQSPTVLRCLRLTRNRSTPILFSRKKNTQITSDGRTEAGGIAVAVAGHELISDKRTETVQNNLLDSISNEWANDPASKDLANS